MERSRSRFRHLVTLATLVVAFVVAGFIPRSASFADTSAATSSTSSSTIVPPATSAIASTTQVTIPRPVPVLKLGSRGVAVRTLQRRLSALGYWTGPLDGLFGNVTEQAAYALQKAASLRKDGAVGAATAAALARGVRPRPRSRVGYMVEINLRSDLLMIVKNGNPITTLNTSTGGGYSYTYEGVRSIATTPRGVFHVFRQVNRLDVSPLGQLWRPKYFTGGYAIHGSSYVPPVPVSHGCVRISNEAINWIWASNRMPIGTKVWVYY